MMNFLKSFFDGGKGSDEQALQAQIAQQNKQRDVMMVEGCASEETEEEAESCGTGCCGGCNR